MCEDGRVAERARSGGFIGSVRRWLGGPRPAPLSAPVAAEREPAGERDPRVQILLAEWQDIRASLRSCDRQRLAQLALFLILSVVLALGYLPIAVASEPRWAPARWALPGLGALLGVVFLALEVGSLAYRREWSRRGRQIETALQVLVPGIGHVRSLALLSEFDPQPSVPVRIATGAVGLTYGAVLLAWIAALLVAALVPLR
jgi:hypothetical protein